MLIITTSILKNRAQVKREGIVVRDILLSQKKALFAQGECFFVDESLLMGAEEGPLKGPELFKFRQV